MVSLILFFYYLSQQNSDPLSLDVDWFGIFGFTASSADTATCNHHLLVSEPPASVQQHHTATRCSYFQNHQHVSQPKN